MAAVQTLAIPYGLLRCPPHDQGAASGLVLPELPSHANGRLADSQIDSWNPEVSMLVAVYPLAVEAGGTACALWEGPGGLTHRRRYLFLRRRIVARLGVEADSRHACRNGNARPLAWALPDSRLAP